MERQYTLRELKELLKKLKKYEKAYIAEKIGISRTKLYNVVGERSEKNVDSVYRLIFNAFADDLRDEDDEKKTVEAKINEQIDELRNKIDENTEVLRLILAELKLKGK